MQWSQLQIVFFKRFVILCPCIFFLSKRDPILILHKLREKITQETQVQSNGITYTSDNFHVKLISRTNSKYEKQYYWFICNLCDNYKLLIFIIKFLQMVNAIQQFILCISFFFFIILYFVFQEQVKAQMSLKFEDLLEF